GTRWDIGTNVNYHSAFVIVDSYEKEVWGYYQHEKNAFEKAVAALPKVGKLAVGVVTLGLTAAIGLCPPCSAALAVLQATEFLVRLIPGGDVFGNVLAMLNPLNFTECAIKWGFDTLSPTSGGPISDQDATLAGLKIEAGVGTRAVKSIAIKDPTVLAKYEKYSTRLKKGAAVLTFAYGLYDNRIDQFDFSEANASELRNTDEYVNCLANTWGDPREPGVARSAGRALAGDVVARVRDRRLQLVEEVTVVAQRPQHPDRAEQLDVPLAHPLDEHGDAARFEALHDLGEHV